MGEGRRGEGEAPGADDDVAVDVVARSADNVDLVRSLGALILDTGADADAAPHVVLDEEDGDGIAR